MCLENNGTKGRYFYLHSTAQNITGLIVILCTSRFTINSSGWESFSIWSDSPLGVRSGRVNGYVLHDENLLYEICMEESAQQPDSCCSITSLERRHTLSSSTILLNLKLMYKQHLIVLWTSQGTYSCFSYSKNSGGRISFVFTGENGSKWTK